MGGFDNEIIIHLTSENTGKFLLRNLAALTNSIYCISQHGALMNRFPVMLMPIGLKRISYNFLIWIYLLKTERMTNRKEIKEANLETFVLQIQISGPN